MRVKYVLNQKMGAIQRLFLLIVALPSLTANAETDCRAAHLDEYADVSYVHDGDTVHLDDGRKLRLIGINTPELARHDRPEQAFAQAARDTLIKRLARHDNRVALVYGKERQDRHERTLVHLFSPDGDNLQAHLLAQGLATAIAHPPNLTYAECYARMEKAARCRGSGIWSQPDDAVLQATQLNADSAGFHLVSGKIDRVKSSKKGVWLFMAGLMIGIYREDLAHFDTAELLSLTGKPLIVRGWLQPSRRTGSKNRSGGRSAVKFFVRIRHPDAIEIYSAGLESGC